MNEAILGLQQLGWALPVKLHKEVWSTFAKSASEPSAPSMASRVRRYCAKRYLR
jgi:hypothetical protein